MHRDHNCMIRGDADPNNVTCRHLLVRRRHARDLRGVPPAGIAGAQSAKPAAAVEIDHDADAAPKGLRAMPAAKTVATKALAVPVFPEIDP